MLKNRLQSILISITLSLMLSLQGCSNFSVGVEKFVTETRVLEEFDKIFFDGIGNIHITRGNNNSITIVGESHFIDSLKTTTVDGVLSITVNSNLTRTALDPGQSVHFYITTTDLSDMDLGGNFILNGDTISSDILKIKINGIGTVNIENIQCERLDIALSGGGEVTISGVAAEQQITISGAYIYDAGNLNSDTITANISGTSNVILWAEDALSVSLSDNASVGYYGNLETMGSTDHKNIIFLGLK